MFWTTRQTIIAILIVMVIGWLVVSGLVDLATWLVEHLHWA